jgi:A/G-specific adenine glycosylase
LGPILPERFFLSIALNQPEAILDGNVERVLSRFEWIGREEEDTVFKNRLWRLSEYFVTQGFEEKILPSRLNQALMELGTMTCLPRQPKCLICYPAPASLTKAAERDSTSHNLRALAQKPAPAQRKIAVLFPILMGPSFAPPFPRAFKNIFMIRKLIDKKVIL